MRIPIVVLLAAGVVAACSFPTTTCGCSPPPPAMGIAYGTISAVDGTPVAGAVVSATDARGSCPGNGQSAIARLETPVTSETGRYRMSVGSTGTYDTATVCLQVTARRSADAGAASVVSPPVTLRIRNFPNDSVRVDLNLP